MTLLDVFLLLLLLLLFFLPPLLVSLQVLSTIEDFMWVKLTLVNASGASSQHPGSAGVFGGAASSLGGSSAFGGGGVMPYTLTDMQMDLGRWPPAYYSKQGK